MYAYVYNDTYFNATLKFRVLIWSFLKMVLYKKNYKANEKVSHSLRVVGTVGISGPQYLGHSR